MRLLAALLYAVVAAAVLAVGAAGVFQYKPDLEVLGLNLYEIAAWLRQPGPSAGVMVAGLVLLVHAFKPYWLRSLWRGDSPVDYERQLSEERGKVESKAALVESLQSQLEDARRARDDAKDAAAAMDDTARQNALWGLLTNAREHARDIKLEDRWGEARDWRTRFESLLAKAYVAPEEKEFGRQCPLPDPGGDMRECLSKSVSHFDHMKGRWREEPIKEGFDPNAEEWSCWRD